jgi:membrane-associated phospholipid phosphatase
MTPLRTIGFRIRLSVALLTMTLMAAASRAAAAADSSPDFKQTQPHSGADQHVAVPPWTDLGRNALASFSFPKILFHLSATAGTLLIIESGLDTRVHNFFARNTFFDKYSHPGVSRGAVFPAVLGCGALFSGLIGRSSQLISAGSSVLQASLLAVCYSSALKALTGRPGPEPVIYQDNKASQAFRFGFLRGGIYYGWPSGHLLANTAAVTSLFSFYGDKTWLKIAGGTYLSYLYLSVISHGRSSMHWFSDTVAGGLMGFVIGSSVGQDFRRRWEGKKADHAGLSFYVVPQVFGISVCIGL